jgi:hypothetical protein
MATCTNCRHTPHLLLLLPQLLLVLLVLLVQDGVQLCPGPCSCHPLPTWSGGSSFLSSVFNFFQLFSSMASIRASASGNSSLLLLRLLGWGLHTRHRQGSGRRSGKRCMHATPHGQA